MPSDAYSNLRLFSCNSHPELAEEIAEHMMPGKDENDNSTTKRKNTEFIFWASEK